LQVIRFGRILYEPFAFLQAVPDNECVRFCRRMRGEASHETAPAFSTGEPSYLVVASTSGNASPTTPTISKASATGSLVGFRLIESKPSSSRDAIQTALCVGPKNGEARSAAHSHIGQRQRTRSLAINVSKTVLRSNGRRHQYSSGMAHDVRISRQRRDSASDEFRGFGIGEI